MNNYCTITMRIPRRDYQKIKDRKDTFKMAERLGDQALKSPLKCASDYIELDVIISHQVMTRKMPVLIGNHVIKTIQNHKKGA